MNVRPLSAAAGGVDVVVLGLSLSSAWGNGHATTWRALLRAMARRGHRVTFLERDTPWYAAHRDLPAPDFCQFALYPDLAALEAWRLAVAAADVVIVGSFVPDGVAVGRWVQRHATGVKAFYDIDTPVTLARLAAGETDYISQEIIRGYDVYLSFSGGPILDVLTQKYGARAARALYCSVDPSVYRPLGIPHRWDLSYLGAYSPDRQPTLERLLLDVARRAPDRRFCVAGAQYPADIAWPANVERIEHVAPPDHAAFYAASRFTLNVTRADMIAAGYSPSVRLFEAAACGTPILSDRWAGLDTLLKPGREILLADEGAEVLTALCDMEEARRAQIGAAARARILAGHTADHRAAELEDAVLEAGAVASPLERRA